MHPTFLSIWGPCQRLSAFRSAAPSAIVHTAINHVHNAPVVACMLHMRCLLGTCTNASGLTESSRGCQNPIAALRIVIPQRKALGTSTAACNWRVQGPSAGFHSGSCAQLLCICSALLPGNEQGLKCRRWLWFRPQMLPCCHSWLDHRVGCKERLCTESADGTT